MRYIKFALIFVLMISFAGCQQTAGSEKTERDGIFIHVSSGSEDSHKVLMALNMAVMMSETKDVVMYFDINGVNILLKDSPDVTFKDFPNSKTQIEKLLKKGVTIMACPKCLSAAGKKPEDLATGVKIADKETFFNFTKGRILTLNY